MPTNRSRAIAVAALLASGCDIPRGDERLCVEPLYGLTFIVSEARSCAWDESG